MILTRLLGDTPLAEFMDRHLFRLPFARPGGAAAFVDLGTPEVLASILASKDPDVMVARQGRRGDGTGTPTFAQAEALRREGYTVLVRHAERSHPGIGALAEEFRAAFGAPVNVHLYRTPPGQSGFGWHYDVEEVFLLQTRGTKTYSLRKNSVHPWPLLETMPRDLGFEREVTPVMECALAAGDWLYIPAGTWHVAKAGAEDSITLAVGVMSPAAIAVYDFLRKRLLELPMWRQRLPVDGLAGGGTEAVETDYRELFKNLGKDLARNLDDAGLARAFMASRRDQPPPPVTKD